MVLLRMVDIMIAKLPNQTSIANILYLWLLSVLVTRAAESDSLQLGGLLSILRQHSSLFHLPPLSPEEIKQVHETVTARYYWLLYDSGLETQFWRTTTIPYYGMGDCQVVVCYS